MNALLTLLALVLLLGLVVAETSLGPPAVLVCLGVAVPIGLTIYRSEIDRAFLLRLFVAGLLVRVLIGIIIFFFGMQEFFGGDAYTYDSLGMALIRAWRGDQYYRGMVDQFSGGGGWGMLYMVAAVYAIIGRNMLAIQLVNAVLGAATACVIYLCAYNIFQHRTVARLAGLFVAFYPSLVLWSAQGLKDAPIVFLLALAMLATLRLGERLSFKYFALLVCALFALLSLRFYVFYMVVTAVGGAFVIGMRVVSAQSIGRQFVIIIGIGLAITYLGVLRTASSQFETYGNLERVQQSRADLSQSAHSGFGQDVDVSTTAGALSAIPVGMVYLLFAPFPWQLASLRQSITLPEMIAWWGSFPLLIMGLWFTLRYRLRRALPILIFTAMLTLAYSIFQGNVGTAYRQRSQILVFYFIFVAIGFVLLKERKEEQRRQAQAAKELALQPRPPQPRGADEDEWKAIADNLSQQIGS